jgi:hypothetical protein
MLAHILALLLLIVVTTVVSLLTTKELKYYDILGSSPADDLASIKAKYKKLALKYHPDRNQHDTTRQMTLLDEAYNYLVVLHNGGGEKAFSVEGTQILTMIETIWNGIPQQQKTILLDKLKLYGKSEHIGADFVLVINSIFSPEAQSFGFAVVTLLATSGVVLTSIGLCTVLYGCYRLIWFVLWLAWRCGLGTMVYRVVRFFLQAARNILLTTLRLVLRLLAGDKADEHAKQE